MHGDIGCQGKVPGLWIFWMEILSRFHTSVIVELVKK